MQFRISILLFSLLLSGTQLTVAMENVPDNELSEEDIDGFVVTSSKNPLPTHYALSQLIKSCPVNKSHSSKTHGWICDENECKKPFSNEYNLKRHKEEVHFICITCTAQCTSLPTIEKHIHANHPKRKINYTIICHVCQKVLESRRSSKSALNTMLQKHLKTPHHK